MSLRKRQEIQKMLRKINFDFVKEKLNALRDKANGLLKGKKSDGPANNRSVKTEPAAAKASAAPKPHKTGLGKPSNTVAGLIPEDDIYASSAGNNPSLKIKEEDLFMGNSGDFFRPISESDVEDIDLKPLGDDLPQMVKARKKILISQIFRDLFSGLIVAICAIACALLLAESYITKPAPVYAWLAFIPFAIAIFNMRSAVYSFIVGWLTGGIFYFVILHWISGTVFEGLGNNGIATLSLTALSCVLAVQFALFSLGSYYLKRLPLLWPLACACLWVGLEILHQLIALKFMAFPWFVLGYTQFNFLYLIQISSYTGVYGVSFVVIFTSLVAGYLFLRIHRAAKVFYFILAVCVLLLTLSFGHQVIKEQLNYMQASPNNLRIALMQPYTHKLFIAGYDEDVVYTIAGQMEALKGKKASLVIWPESSLPGDLLSSEYMDYIKEQSKELNVWQIFGGTEIIGGEQYVAAVLVNEEGISDDYKKTRLVPFGEFLPFQGILGGFYEGNGITSLTGTFTEGKDPGKVFVITADVPGKNKKAEYQFGTEICFESIFPSIYRAQALSGADFFVNISNDGWFLVSAAPYQHLRANVFRAVENRRPLLRSTNTGISAWIDSLGKIRFETGLDKQESSVFNFVFQDRDTKTFYTTHGDLFAYICLALAVPLVIFSMVFLSVRNEY